MKEIEQKSIEVDGVLYSEDEITPSIYFDHVKGLKNKVDNEEQQLVIDNALKMINKCKLTKQTTMAKELSHQVDLALRELNAARRGFDIFIYRKDIESYIDKVEGKAIKLIELERYTREIPDDVIDKITLANEIFDRLYICFTDYTDKHAKKVAKERREKDPILFGAFLDKEDEKTENKVYVEDRLFFIADWTEDNCELTLEEMVRDVKNKSEKDITYKIGSFKDEEEIRNYLNSFTAEPEKNLKPVSLFDKIKSVVKKDEDSKSEAPKKKRGRPPKKKVEE